MTEADWLSATHPRPILEKLGGRASERKLRLFAAACCRRIWHLFPDERCQASIETAERYADGCATENELDVSQRATPHSTQFDPTVTFIKKCAFYAASWAVNQFAMNAAMCAAESATAAVPTPTNEAAAQAVTLRDIVGNPFRPVALDPAWRTEAVVGLAAGIYADRAFDRLPVLADALEDAGCADADMLSHCRGPGPHVRGCWVVDLLLGKS